MLLRLAIFLQPHSNGIGVAGHERAMKDAKPVFLLWIIGLTLRVTMLAVPPVLVLIQSDLGMSGTQVAVLSSLPVVILALASVPGSLMISYLGALRTLVAGMWVMAFGGALRALSYDVWTLYGATVVMAAGLAVMQIALPPLVRSWLPQRVTFGAAVYANGLLVGELFPISLTVMLLPLLWDSWRFGLAFWSIPVVVIAVVIMIMAPRDARASGDTVVPAWMPDWRDITVWKLGCLLGGSNIIYLGTNAFIPAYHTQAGRPDLIVIVLTALNAAQFPASFLLLVGARYAERKIWPFVACGLMVFAGLFGLLTTASGWTIFYGALIGFASAGTLALILPLPALLAAPDNVARVSAAMYVIGYVLGVTLSVVGGVLWDLFADARFGFVSVATGALLMFVAIALPFRRTQKAVA
ncbi:MAG: CynX/NimT family MFS transporter [Pseudorhodoplanes sp.]